MASVGNLIIPEGDFEAVIFDCDGTVVDSMPAHFKAWCIALEQHGVAGIFPEDVFYAMGGRPTTDIVETLNNEHNLALDPISIAAAKRKAFVDNMRQIEVIDEVVDYARKVRSLGIPTAIATGGTRLIIEQTLRVVEVNDLFDEVVTANDVINGKPAPDIFFESARRLGANPERCLVFEDAPAGLIGAQKAGMQTVVVPAPFRFSGA